MGALSLAVIGMGENPAKGAAESQARPSGLPASWLRHWKKPLLTDRPLQIIHGIDPEGRPLSGIGQVLHRIDPLESALPGTGQGIPGAGAGDAVHREMAFYRDRGLGGVVCNVAFRDYLQSEKNWKTLVSGVEACHELGMVVWIYDEQGYPSGAAGGLVLKEHPEYEAQELAYNPSLPEPFVIRPAYEFTHAANNYHAARRYINLIDDRATRLFIEKTHQAYKHRVGARFGATIQAFFTDEPSLITVNLGQIPESARKNVPVVDPLDPAVKPLPAVPWCYDMPDRYKERYSEDLLPVRRSLFTGDTEADRKTRRQFWALIADLVSSRYFEVIRKWCASAGVAASGHTLCEESITHHPTLEGNGLKVLSHLDIPGMDILSSNPESVVNGGWMTAALPSSAAMLTGRRRVMTEVSDFAEEMGGQGPASVAEMQATAAWQAAYGVTDFTLYYDIAGRSADDCRAYGDFVGRLNTLLKPARLDPDILLYYPIHDLWSEYRPSADPIGWQNLTPRAQKIVGSFTRLGQNLTRGQMPFALIDHEFLAGATVRSDGSLAIKEHTFRTLVLPEDVELPPAAARTVEQFRKRGGCVLRDTAALFPTVAALTGAVQPSYRLDSASEQIILGRFMRAGRPLLLLLNTGRTPYAGQLKTPGPGFWTRLDPATEQVEATAADASGRIPFKLAPRQAVVLAREK